MSKISKTISKKESQLYDQRKLKEAKLQYATIRKMISEEVETTPGIDTDELFTPELIHLATAELTPGNPTGIPLKKAGPSTASLLKRLGDAKVDLQFQSQMVIVGRSYASVAASAVDKQESPSKPRSKTDGKVKSTVSFAAPLELSVKTHDQSILFTKKPRMTRSDQFAVATEKPRMTRSYQFAVATVHQLQRRPGV